MTDAKPEDFETLIKEGIEACGEMLDEINRGRNVLLPHPATQKGMRWIRAAQAWLKNPPHDFS